MAKSGVHPYRIPHSLYADLNPDAPMIQKYLRIVLRVSRKLRIQYPHILNSFTPEDLVSIGTLGLIEAILKRDGNAAEGEFVSYAKLRIMGTIIDAWRQENPWERFHENAKKAIDSAKKHLRQCLGREPEKAEIAAFMKISLEEFFELELIAASVDAPLSFDEPRKMEDGEVDESARWGDFFADDSALPDERAAQNNTREKALSVLMHGKFSEEERNMMHQRIVFQRGYREIGLQYGITESRVCQITSEIERRIVLTFIPKKRKHR